MFAQKLSISNSSMPEEVEKHITQLLLEKNKNSAISKHRFKITFKI